MSMALARMAFVTSAAHIGVLSIYLSHYIPINLSISLSIFLSIYLHVPANARADSHTRTRTCTRTRRCKRSLATCVQPARRPLLACLAIPRLPVALGLWPRLVGAPGAPEHGQCGLAPCARPARLGSAAAYGAFALDHRPNRCERSRPGRVAVVARRCSALRRCSTRTSAAGTRRAFQTWLPYASRLLRRPGSGAGRSGCGVDCLAWRALPFRGRPWRLGCGHASSVRRARRSTASADWHPALGRRASARGPPSARLRWTTAPTDVSDRGQGALRLSRADVRRYVGWVDRCCQLFCLSSMSNTCSLLSHTCVVIGFAALRAWFLDVAAALVKPARSCCASV
jgi:hypothetical protein